ncbi:MAG TPA: HipA family kinase [Pyrinomonadaceae bacterium]|jgi:hypothetical protein
MNLRTVRATRYVTPLREGGSLPAIIEADDDGMYVLKFRGAGQGVKALIAELVAGEIGRVLGLRVPEIVFVELDPILGRSEPDPEIQDLIKSSAGINLALDYLPGSITYDPLIQTPDSKLASSIVWFDAYATNVDRTPRNANMLLWHKQLWLIDHGAALYFHHNWNEYLQRSRSPFTLIKDHVLLSSANDIQEIDEVLTAKLTPEIINGIIELIPDEWLGGETQFAGIGEHRNAYFEYLTRRLESPRNFVQEVNNVRNLHV